MSYHLTKLKTAVMGGWLSHPKPVLNMSFLLQAQSRCTVLNVFMLKWESYEGSFPRRESYCCMGYSLAKVADYAAWERRKAGDCLH